MLAHPDQGVFDGCQRYGVRLGSRAPERIGKRREACVQAGFEDLALSCDCAAAEIAEDDLSALTHVGGLRRMPVVRPPDHQRLGRLAECPHRAGRHRVPGQVPFFGADARGERIVPAVQRGGHQAEGHRVGDLASLGHREHDIGDGLGGLLEPFDESGALVIAER